MQVKLMSEWVTNFLAVIFSMTIILSVLSEDIQSVVTNTIFVAVLFAFQRRLILKNNALITKSQFALLGKTIYVFNRQSIDLSAITEAVLTQKRHKYDLNITYEQGGGHKISHFSFWRQGELVKKLLAMSSVKYVFKTSAKQHTQSVNRGERGNATEETVSDIFHLNSSRPTDIKTHHSILRFALPLPDNKKKIVFSVVGVCLFFAIIVVVSAQNWIAGCVLLAVAYLSYWLTKAHLCNKYYFISESPQSDIVVSDNSLLLPALLFEDRQAHEFKKEQVQNIDLKWNYYVAGSFLTDATFQSRGVKQPHVVELTFVTEQGMTLALSGTAIDGPALLLALTHNQYPVSIERTSKQALPMLTHIRIAVIFAIIGIIISSMIRFI
ncbi:hypothetical protein [Pseudoalteromonas sp. SWYJZ12]|uniref:hypothetical protein n=1 Tax=Pseudoalteromonas sp. SWYJZ12 TaxID=2792067 RepID=UPI0018CD6B1D|nr:hypothetical protein [Pseudoalteromonas sp. SWYJZ12]MBH0001995.1 hypothetical protein [Pseudoalteromonas sp. SWYJZ12]